MKYIICKNIDEVQKQNIEAKKRQKFEYSSIFHLCKFQEETNLHPYLVILMCRVGGCLLGNDF